MAKAGKYGVAPEDLTVGKIRGAIPREMFRQDTVKSTYYLIKDLVQVALFHYLMTTWVLPYVSSYTATLTNPIAVFAINTVMWNAFWFFQGLNFTALWVIAHEAGHGAYSPSNTINELVGYVVHTALLVPYHSWRVSHGTHHKYTNHLTLDTVFVPRGLPEPLKEAIADSPIIAFFQFILMLTMGWPGYLFANAAGQNYGRRTSHFEPSSPLFRPHDRWAVLVSDFGLVVVCALIYLGVQQSGAWNVFAYYGVPYLWTNAWLVYITFMHHHDPRIPHYSDKHFNFVRGALCSIDRDYGFVNGWLHNINDSHVVHHLFHDMPHYNAITVTNKYIRPILGEYYASDARPMMTQTIDSWRNCRYVVPSEGITYFRR